MSIKTDSANAQLKAMSYAGLSMLVPLRCKLEKLPTCIYKHKPPNLFKVQLKATFNILYKMEFVTSSKGKLALFYAASCAQKSI